MGNADLSQNKVSVLGNWRGRLQLLTPWHFVPPTHQHSCDARFTAQPIHNYFAATWTVVRMDITPIRGALSWQGLKRNCARFMTYVTISQMAGSVS